jgi:S-adenosyl methyltransferase
VSDGTSASGGTPEIDTSVPHSARIWNYWLGGKDNYPVDRLAGDQVMQMFPEMTSIARLQRSFLARSIRYLTGWRPEATPFPEPGDVPGKCGVGRKP